MSKTLSNTGQSDGRCTSLATVPERTDSPQPGWINTMAGNWENLANWEVRAEVVCGHIYHFGTRGNISQLKADPTLHIALAADKGR